MQTNPKDPILKSGPEAQRALFERFVGAARNFPIEAVLSAAFNMVVNALRQTYPTREKALARFDELAAQMKGLLANHYDSAGRKKGIFPYNQTIEMAHFVDRDKAH